MNFQERQATIGQCLRVASPMRDRASELATAFNLLMEDAKDLDPDEEARLLSEMMRSISHRMVKLHGGM